MNQRNEACWCGSQKKWKKCHYPQVGPKAPQNLQQEYLKKYKILIKTKEQIEQIRASCRLAASILDQTCNRAVAGATTLELNDFAHQLQIQAGAIPAPLHYGTPPYPKSICTSVNEVVCHGIPDKRVLVDGDIINIDVTTILNGYYGDCSRMVIVGGHTTPERQKVVDVSYDCMMNAIEILKPGLPLCEIGNTIHAHATKEGCSVVYQFVGHGTGVYFHENPQIPYCHNRIQTLLVPGMTITIEPMINAGVAETNIDPKDQWTATTADGKASAQWEHTVLITDKGYEILTQI